MAIVFMLRCVSGMAVSEVSVLESSTRACAVVVLPTPGVPVNIMFGN